MDTTSTTYFWTLYRAESGALSMMTHNAFSTVAAAEADVRETLSFANFVPVIVDIIAGDPYDAPGSLVEAAKSRFQTRIAKRIGN